VCNSRQQGQTSKHLSIVSTCLRFGLAHHFSHHWDSTEGIKFWSKNKRFRAGCTTRRNVIRETRAITRNTARNSGHEGILENKSGKITKVELRE